MAITGKGCTCTQAEQTMPFWSMANKSGISLLLALFSIAAFACLASWAKVCLVSLTFSAKKNDASKIIFNNRICYSSIDLVRSCDMIPEGLLPLLRKSAMIIWVTFCLSGMFSISFSTSGDAAVDVTVGSAAGTAARSVVVGVSATSPWFSVYGLCWRSHHLFLLLPPVHWLDSDAWAVSAFAVWTDNRAKAVNRGRRWINYFHKATSFLFNRYCTIVL